MAVKSELEFQGMLLSTGLVQPIKVVGSGKLSALCRLVPGREAEWLRTVEYLLRVSEQQGIQVHICKQFVLKNDQMVAGWYLAIEEKSARRQKLALEALGPVLASVTPELGETPPAPVIAAPAAPQAALETEEELEEEETEPVPETADILARRKAYQAKTTAAPRAPAPAPNVELPTLDPASAAKKIVQRGMAVDSKGRSRQVLIEEMPLPGVYTEDMNKPSEKGRGANRLG